MCIHFVFTILEAENQPSLIRYCVAFVLPTLLACRGLMKRNIDLTGALAGEIIILLFLGVLIGISMFLSNYIAATVLVTCYFSTSKVTKIGEKIKESFEVDFKKNGQRNWIQIISNLGIANIAVLTRAVFFGLGEKRIDLLNPNNYWSSWLDLSIFFSIAAALGDTFSSEIGSVLSDRNTEPFLITTFKRVPRGTNGGVTIHGLIAACAGGLLIGLSSFISTTFLTYTNDFSSSESSYIQTTPQWPLLHFCLYSGLFGSILDSYLGATLQFTGFDRRRRRIVEKMVELDRFGQESTDTIEHISGCDLLDNHEVNLIMTLIIGTIMPTLAITLWPIDF
ncbi:hypothetical protein QR98_0041520 [Sarcoptes scabiei]|uniref:Transmembrane protein 19 n=1 Tax=Sarcoptes scabiei TaxID=52283 RepID=A0A132A432_SARSC|nr:hypothetical protein QR98_0041520 [Sarcoptes scabiei]